MLEAYLKVILRRRTLSVSVPASITSQYFNQQSARIKFVH